MQSQEVHEELHQKCIKKKERNCDCSITGDFTGVLNSSRQANGVKLSIHIAEKEANMLRESRVLLTQILGNHQMIQMTELCLSSPQNKVNQEEM